MADHCAMKFVVKALSSGARTGLLQLEGRPPVDTPCLLLATRRGLPAFIPPELLQSLHPDATLLQISPLHFLEAPPAKLIAQVGGAHGLSSLSTHGMFAVARDSVLYESDGEGSSKLGASFETFSGRRLVGPDKYMEITNALAPDVWTSLADEVPAWVNSKRNNLSVDRTVRWLDHCLSLQRDKRNSAFGVVVGGLDLEARRRSAAETASREVAGFSLGGFGLGETFGQRAALLEATIERLPSNLPRHISGLGMPEEILQGISHGVDIFDSIYPYTLTMGGYAMIFPVHMGEANGSLSGKGTSMEEQAKLGADSAKINLRSVIYRRDASPILQDCQCYCCRKHTRAYINHLLIAHEMLAQTLLDIHNQYHYLCFFRAIRNAISGNRFEQYRDWFTSRRHSEAFSESSGDSAAKSNGGTFQSLDGFRSQWLIKSGFQAARSNSLLDK